MVTASLVGYFLSLAIKEHVLAVQLKQLHEKLLAEHRIETEPVAKNKIEGHLRYMLNINGQCARCMHQGYAESGKRVFLLAALRDLRFVNKVSLESFLHSGLVLSRSGSTSPGATSSAKSSLSSTRRRRSGVSGFTASALQWFQWFSCLVIRIGAQLVPVRRLRLMMPNAMQRSETTDLPMAGHR